MFSLQTRGLATSFEGLNSSLTKSTGELLELQSHANIMAHAGFPGMVYSYTGSEHVKQH